MYETITEAARLKKKGMEFLKDKKNENSIEN
jgi:hypothetical protein